MHRQGKRGFTLIELLVVVAIIALLISILLPSLGKAKELANRVHCSTNVRGMVSCMIVYGQENSDMFPSVVGPTSGSTYAASFALVASGGVATTSEATISNYYSAPAHRGSPLACMWWMVLDRRIPAKMFLCKSDRTVGVPAAVMDSSGKYFDNFQDPTQISYSLANPWTASGSVGPWWRSSVDSNVVVASDMAPLSGQGGKNTAALVGSAGTPKAFTSGNHEDKGQNVGFGDAHVEWTVSPYINSNQDNIWTVGAVSTGSGGTPITVGQIPGGIPASQMNSGYYDVVMTPCRNTSDNTIGP